LQHTIDILSYVAVPEAKHQVTHRLQDFCSMLVMLRTNSMLSAVKLDNEVRISAKEIDDEAIDRALPPKLPAVETAITQPEPQ
jgi:hypothetical protein